MEKEKNDIEKEESFLNQLILTLEQAELKLEEAYKNNKPEQFKSIKQFILKIQSKIGEIIK